LRKGGSGCNWVLSREAAERALRWGGCIWVLGGGVEVVESIVVISAGFLALGGSVYFVIRGF